MNRYALGLLLLAAFVLQAHAVTQISLTATVNLNPDSSAHVVETYSFYLDTDTEVEQFTQFQAFGQNTIVGWRRFVPRLTYHIGSPVAPTNTTVTALRVLNIGPRSGEIQLSYDLQAPLFTSEKLGSRITRYTLDPSFLLYSTTSTGQTILTPLDRLEFVFPADAKFDPNSLTPRPDVAGQKVSWTGPLSSSWDVSYTLEESLEDEVAAFFNQLYQNAYALVPSLLPYALVLLVAGFLANKLLRSNK